MEQSVEEWMDRESGTVQEFIRQKAHAIASLKDEQIESAAARKEAGEAKEARDFLSGLAKVVQQKAHERIASVVSSCMAAVFDDPYEFEIRFEQKRGRTEAKLIFRRDGLEVSPISGSGGGTVDVAAFALRAACLVLHRPRLRRILVLDEPFKFLSRDLRPRVRSMLEEMSKDLKLQIVMVTHDDDLKTGKEI